MHAKPLQLWHPWLRIEGLLRAILAERWSDVAWQTLKRELPRVLIERGRIRRAGSFNDFLLILALGLSVGACSSLSVASPHDQRGYLVEEKNRIEMSARYEPLTFADFLTLPALSAQYTGADWEVVRTLSRRAVSLEGYIAEVIPVTDGATYGRRPEDGDLHVHLRETHQPECFPPGEQGEATGHRGDAPLPAPEDGLVLRGALGPLPAPGARPNLRVAPP